MILNKKTMEESVKQRLTMFLRKSEIKGIDFCETIGVSSGFISGMRKSIQPDKLYAIATNYPELNIEWLLTGSGNMIKGSSQNTNIENTIDMNELMSVVKKFQDQIELKDQEISELKNKLAEFDKIGLKGKRDVV